jgi:HEXXH motif-containing protein
MLPCAIYTDLVNNPIQLAETVVHEAAHSQLNEYIGNPSSLPQEPTWWSPWKQKYRPAFGILHAVYAFSSVLNFLIYLYQSKIGDERCHRQLHRRILQECRRLNEAQQPFEEATRVINNDILQIYLLANFTHTIRFANMLREENIDGSL